MRLPVLLGVLCMLMHAVAMAAEAPLRVRIVEPYIELHTGPGAGFPVVHTIDRGDTLDVLKRKTDWFKVRTVKGKEGWVTREQLELTVSDDGLETRFVAAGKQDFSERDVEVALMSGIFEGAPVIALNAGWGFARNLTAEFAVSQVLGKYSSSVLVTTGIVANPFVDWRVAPYLGIGVGAMQVNPHVTLVQAERDTYGVASLSVGARTWLSRRFVLRVDYTEYVAFESDANNEEYREWKAGLAFFF